MNQTIEQLNTKVDDLLSVRDIIAQTREQLDHYLEQEAGLKADILAEQWPEATLRYDDVTLSRVETKDVKITDAKAVITWMKRNKINIQDFMKLDTLKVKPLLKSATYTQGKTVSGTEAETRQTLRVTER